MAKTKEELNTLKHEYEIVTNKLQELTEDELKTVVGGHGNITQKLYHLATDGNGVWKEGAVEYADILVAGKSVPSPGETISYTDFLNNKRVVKAVANVGHSFKTCTFDSNTKTFTATFN